jgi:hypothetical protein
MVQNCLNCKHYNKEKAGCDVLYDVFKRYITIAEPQYERPCCKPIDNPSHK